MVCSFIVGNTLTIIMRLNVGATSGAQLPREGDSAHSGLFFPLAFWGRISPVWVVRDRETTLELKNQPWKKQDCAAELLDVAVFLHSKYYAKYYAMYSCVYYIIIIIINWSPQCKAGREWEHSINAKTPHNQPMEGRKR